jgi:hypothetical protein
MNRFPKVAALLLLAMMSALTGCAMFDGDDDDYECNRPSNRSEVRRMPRAIDDEAPPARRSNEAGIYPEKP